MKWKQLSQVLAISALIPLLCMGANDKTAHALTENVRQSTNTQTFYVDDSVYYTIDHYFYYGNGAIRSLNNKIGSTYNFTQDDFNSIVGAYSDTLLGEVNYDDTNEVWKKPPSDNLAFLNSLMKMPSRSTKWLTNYSDDDLKKLNLISSDTDINSSNVANTGEATTSELVSDLSYLVSKDYYTVPKRLTVKKSTGNTPLSAKETIPKSDEYRNWIYAAGTDQSGNTSVIMRKSDLIMTLSKIFFGVQNSSPLILHDNSERDGNVWSTEDISAPLHYGSNYSKCYNGTSGEAYYGKSSNTYEGGSSGTDYYGVQFVGDYWFYFNPNVYELYLSEALNDGIITISDLSSDSPFRQDYKKQSTNNWGNGQLLIDDSIKEDSLGYSYRVEYNGETLTIDPIVPEYFGEKETMTMMEALRLVEAYMRAKDENMSETEEMIIRYKLGLSVLSYLDPTDQSTVTYLIAKGVLDGNDSSLSSILYSDATIARLYPILYRVANNEARTDFSVIQLTDSETFWASESFSENTFNIFEPTRSIIHETGEIKHNGQRIDNDTDEGGVEEEADFESSRLPFLSSPIVVQAAKADKGIGIYQIIKYFDTESVYKIGSTTIAQLYDNGKPSTDTKKERENLGISKIEQTKYEYEGKQHDTFKVTFTISATSSEAAVSAVDNKISLLSELDKYKKTVSGVTQVTSDGEAVSLVSQTSLKQAFSNIVVLEDKILMNTVTGTMAYFSFDTKMALIGSQIITSDYLCIVKVGDEVYYDLNALITLLSTAYVDTLGPQLSVIVTDIEQTQTVKISTTLTDANDYLMSAQYIRMYTDDKSGEAKDDKSGFACIVTDASTAKVKKQIKNANIDCYLKLNTLSSVANMLTKTFSVNYNGKRITGTIIVNLQYAIPPLGTFQDWLSSELSTSTTYTYQDATKVINTPPDKLDSELGIKIPNNFSNELERSALNDWWYSNYGMSNALCNFMYGTSGRVYIYSGYVCPSVTLLIDNVGKQAFSTWIGKSDASNRAQIRDTVFSSIFKDFAMGDNYLKYNGGTQASFWNNYYQYGKSAPDFPGFNQKVTAVTNVIANIRKFEVFEQPGIKSIAKDSVVGQISSDQKLKTYGTRYAITATGAVYQRVDTICGPTDPLFACVYKYIKGEISEIASLTVRSREAYSVLLNTGQSLLRNGTVYRYAGKRTINQLQYYGILPAKLLATDGNVVSKCYELKLTKSSGNTFAIKVWLQGTNKRLCALNSSDFADSYSSNSIATIGGISESLAKSMLSSTLYNTGVFLNPSSLNSNPELMKSILGNDELYLFTDKGNIEGVLNGKLYQWTGEKLLEVTKTSDLTTIASNNIPIYAIPIYYAPCDTFFVQRDSAGSIILESNFINKALHHIQYDLTSINNQLIEAYLSEQQGVVKINTLTDGTVVMLGDTVWTKAGDYWQSSPIHDSTNVKAIISGDQDLMWYSNNLFSGLYLNVQGKQYSLQGYVDEMKLGNLVGSEKQYKKGIVYLDGNEIKVRKKDKIRVASAKTSAEYVSVMCKFNNELLVRPINAESTQYTYLGHCSTGIVPYANYPFFDAEASWDSQRMVLYPVNVSRYKPSPAFQDTKETLDSQFKQLFIEDSWNYIWVLIIILASYLLVMSWVAYGIVTMGVGRAGFEALTLRNRNGNGKGIDFIKLATFGVYSLDQEIPLTRLIVISFGCCFIIITVLLVIF